MDHVTADSAQAKIHVRKLSTHDDCWIELAPPRVQGAWSITVMLWQLHSNYHTLQRKKVPYLGSRPAEKSCSPKTDISLRSPESK